MNDNEYVEYFLSKGIIEESGFSNETGEILYSINPKMKHIMPSFYEDHLNFINSEIMYFWEHGFLDIDLLKDDPLVSLTDKAFSDYEISLLSKDKQWSLLELKRLLMDR